MHLPYRVPLAPVFILTLPPRRCMHQHGRKGLEVGLLCVSAPWNARAGPKLPGKGSWTPIPTWHQGVKKGSAGARKRDHLL